MRGLFYGIGHMPNSALVAGQVDLDEKGYVKARAPANPDSLPAVRFSEWSTQIASAMVGVMTAKLP